MSTQPGDLIAHRFLVERSLGKGGYGEVWEATQLSVDRRVALKVLIPSAQAHDEARRRFEREARLAARVKHPNAVGVIDFGEADGHFFLVMELVTGPSLKERLKTSHRLSPIDAARIGGRIAAALGAAHRLGLVHRDLKPANVILTEIDGEEQPVVIDFGLAKLWEEEDDGTHITRSNVMVGTPAYMAPECVKGDTIDQRTDLYALGVLLFEMITGQVPLRGKTAVETATRQVTEKPPSLADRPELGVPTALSNLVTALLAKDPADRPRDAEAVQDVLFAVAGIARSGKMPAVVAPPSAAVERVADAAPREVAPHSASVVSALTLVTVPSGPVLDSTLIVPPPVVAVEPASVASVTPDTPFATQGAVFSPALAREAPSRRSGPRAWVAIAAAALALAAVAAIGAARYREPAEANDDRVAAVVSPAAVAPAPPDGSAAAVAAQVAEPTEVGPAAVVAPGAEVEQAVPIGLETARVAVGDALAAAVEAQAFAGEALPTHGWVTVTVEPFGAVSIDGESVGDAPIRRERVSPGRHTIEARQGDRTTTESVTVDAGEEERVRMRFEPAP
jgi:serine/threonine protein kinase